MPTDRRMDDLIEDVRFIREDVGELLREVTKNGVILEKNTADIALHIKRTDLLEEKVQAALLPTLLAKWAVALAAGTLTIGGLVMAVHRLILAVGIK